MSVSRNFVLIELGFPFADRVTPSSFVSLPSGLTLDDEELLSPKPVDIADSTSTTAEVTPST